MLTIWDTERVHKTDTLSIFIQIHLKLSARETCDPLEWVHVLSYVLKIDYYIVTFE